MLNEDILESIIIADASYKGQSYIINFHKNK